MSFLRKLFECCFTWHLKSSPSLEEGDVIIAHAGAVTDTGEPARVNEMLSKVIRGLDAEKRRPIIVQGELAPYLSGLPVIASTQVQGKSERYIDTVDATEFFRKRCLVAGWRRPILLSYQPHLWRGVAVAQKLGMDVLVAEIPPAIYEPKSSQFWMRSPWLNYPRELAVRLLWLMQGKI